MQSNEEDRCVHGTCIWFSDEKGYGFLLSDDGVSSMVHYTDIKEPGFKRLYRGQRVTYEELETERGRSARRVKYMKDFEGFYLYRRSFITVIHCLFLKIYRV